MSRNPLASITLILSLAACTPKEVDSAADTAANEEAATYPGDPVSGGGRVPSDVECPWGTSWSGESSKYLSSGSSYTFYYAPARKGTHYIWYINDSSSSSLGKITPYWYSSSSPSWTSWGPWYTSYNWKRQTLTSGSSDVSYKFTIKSTSGSGTYWWGFCTD